MDDHSGFSRSKGLAPGLVSVTAGVAVLIGWTFDIPILKSVIPNVVSMKANTAAGFVLAGLSLALLAVAGSVWARRVSRMLAGVMALLGLLTLFQYLSGLDFGIDQLLFREAPGAVGTLAPNRMAPTTAVNFLLLGGALALVSFSRTVLAAQYVVLVTGLMGLLPLLGYMYGATALIGIGRYTQMAVHTAALFVLLSLGVLLARPRDGLMEPVTSGVTGGWLLRRAVPFVIGLPLILGWLRVQGEEHGYFTSPMGVALMMTTLMTLLILLVWWAARALNRADAVRREAEEQLRERERLYRSLFENMLNGLAYCKMIVEDGRPKDFVYLEVNEAFATLTGLRNVTGKRVSEVIPGICESDPGLIETYGRVAATGEPAKFETYVAALKSWFSVSVYSPERGYFVAVFDVITARKQIEGEREITISLLRLLTARNDVHGLIKEVTALMQVWSGCEAVGVRMRDGDDFPYFETRGFPAEFVEAERHLCLRDGTGATVRDVSDAAVLECMCGNILCGRFDPNLSFFTHDGSFWSNCTTALLASTTEKERQARTRNRCNSAGYESVALIPLRFGDETFGLLQLNDRRPNMFTLDRIRLFERLAGSVAVGISQRMAASELTASERKYRLLAENVTDVLWVLNVDRRQWEYISPSVERLLGYTVNEMQGRTWEALLRAESIGKIRTDIALRIERLKNRPGAVHNYVDEIEQTRKDGSTIWTEVATRYRRNESGEVVITGVSRDITERKQLESRRHELETQLQHSQKMESVGRLAGGVAHDFNNILTGIGGYTELAMDRLDAGDPVREDMAEVQRLAKRAAELTRQLLAFSRRQPLEPVVLNLNETVAGTAKMLKRVLGENVDFQFIHGVSLGNVRADPGQIEQILMNLVVNARDAMPEGGKLTIETANVDLDAEYASRHIAVAPGPYVMLAVSDTGSGMDDATKARLFEPFFTTKEKGKGTGLGLAMVYGIVKQHNGSIWVYSEPGKGATFKIYLPRSTQEAGPLPAPPPPTNGLRGHETILLVEDEASVRAFAERTLTARGYTVLGASDAEEALRVFRTHASAISLLLTDVVLPGMNGRKLYEQLKTLAPGLKVIYTSGYTDNAIVHQGVLDPGTVFIQKPFTAEGLARRVRQVLDI